MASELAVKAARAMFLNEFFICGFSDNPKGTITPDP